MFLTDPFILPKTNVSFLTKLKRYFYTKKKQESAGTIPYILDKTNQPLFLQFFVSDDGIKGEWCFPKGIVEDKDKNYEERALEETWEEVGLEVELVKKLSPSTYVFFWDKGNIKFTKTVHYFLAKAKTDKVELAKYSTEQSEKDHFKKYTWSSIKEALEKNKHANEQAIIQEAFDTI